MTTPYRKKLIEVALPLEDINREAAREKHIRHGHPCTLHLWWARQPLAASRAVLFASLVDDPEAADADPLYVAACTRLNFTSHGRSPRERLFSFIAELVKWENCNQPEILHTAHELILLCTGGIPPPVYDPFCGGGSIPLEAQRLGLEAHASDLNPVPVLINKALIEIPPRYLNCPPVNPAARRKLGASGSWSGSAGLADDVRNYGNWMRQEAEKTIGPLYPPALAVKESDGTWRHATAEEIATKATNVQSLTVIAWIWTRTIASPDPAARGTHVPMAKSFWLAKKPGRKTWVYPVVTNPVAGASGWHFEVQTEKSHPDGPAMDGTVSRTGAVCILTGTPIPRKYARLEAQAGRMGARMMAIACEGQRGRIYLPPHPAHEAAAAVAPPDGVPDTEISPFSLGFNVRIYGMLRHADLFTARQLHGMMTLSGLVAAAREQVKQDSGGDAGYADAVAVYLAFAVDRISQHFSTLCPWSSHPAHELVITMFARQTLAMPWDFGEINPFCEAANWLKCCDFVAKVIENLPPAKTSNNVQAGGVAEIAGHYGRRGLVFTGPPYYDNVGYADLADYFYIWLRRSLRSFFPDAFQTFLTPKDEEMVANRYRHNGSVELSRKYFESSLQAALISLAKAQHEDYPLALYYTYKQEENSVGAGLEEVRSTVWDVMLGMLMQSGLAVVATWPVRTESITGMKADLNSLASSIVIVCRMRAENAVVISRRDLLTALKRELPEALRLLQKGNIAPVDLAQAAIGPGMAVFSRCARVLESDGTTMGVRTALGIINQMLDEVLAEQEGEFDADTRWALAWCDQYGFSEGAYGQAETLSTAKNTSVSGMVEAGIVAAKAGKVRLLKMGELDPAWNPARDTRLTNWEVVHHLIRTLDTGEEATAKLLARVRAVDDAKADAARDLAYRLYSMSERRKRAQDALGYNALVLAWPELTRLAREIPSSTRDAITGELF